MYLCSHLSGSKVRSSWKSVQGVFYTNPEMFKNRRLTPRITKKGEKIILQSSHDTLSMCDCIWIAIKDYTSTCMWIRECDKYSKILWEVIHTWKVLNKFKEMHLPLLRPLVWWRAVFAVKMETCSVGVVLISTFSVMKVFFHLIISLKFSDLYCRCNNLQYNNDCIVRR